MTIIFSSKGSKVIKDQNGTYTLESNNCYCYHIYWIIPNIVKGQSNSIVFETSSVMTLSQLLSHNMDGLSYEKLSMMRMIIKQVKFFESNNFGLLFVTPEDIITLDGEDFLLLATEIYLNKKIVVYY